MKDNLDELKMDQKEYNTGTARHKEIGRQIVELTKEVDTTIKALLAKIPALKEKAIKARNAAIDRDFACPNRKRRAAEQNQDTFSEVASTFDEFLPSHMFQLKPQEQPEPEQTAPTTQQTPVVEEQPTRDTYLDGVPDCDMAIMKKLRPVVEKFDCKDRVLEALRRFREREDRLETLKDINAMVGKA